MYIDIDIIWFILWWHKHFVSIKNAYLLFVEFLMTTRGLDSDQYLLSERFKFIYKLVGMVFFDSNDNIYFLFMMILYDVILHFILWLLATHAEWRDFNINVYHGTKGIINIIIIVVRTFHTQFKISITVPILIMFYRNLQKKINRTLIYVKRMVFSIIEKQKLWYFSKILI